MTANTITNYNSNLMTIYHNYHLQLFVVLLFFTSCSMLEKASEHGFQSGYYKMSSKKGKPGDVYVEVSEEKTDVYQVNLKMPEEILFSFPGYVYEGKPVTKVVFQKKNLDVDLTSNIFKYRPSVFGLPAQLTTDFNAAIYAGWRHDYFFVSEKKNPLGNSGIKTSNRGYDFGVFLGQGTSTIGAFSTRNKIENEYSGMIIQSGAAGFVESNLASFGISVGFDYLLNKDRKNWIYHKKPWIGFIIGIALN